MAKQSLRDMKKEETWHVLAETSFELAAGKGLDGFTIEDVVQRAHYSRRTFANHFSCKEEAVAMAVLSIGGEQEDVLSKVEVDGDTKPVEALRNWMRLQFTTDLLRKLRKLVGMSKEHPTLEPYVLIVLQRLQQAAQQELDRSYGGQYPTGYTHLLAGAVFGAVLPVIEGVLNVQIPGDPAGEDADGMTFDEYLEFTFDYLKNGF
ncbi:TetR/AcrR family transcriptional regulator [Saccharibacillus sp. CPCC 101409]|uniref:TetR/AcrR family transcriptional regulator n=1 Tax=Saccharibacillus sp. CPCC 101409 TaxID=3058041 RepID=UPI0026717BB2|nr:TetR/AcrR family transcriptional regulator [Saccharibacillus sp. CPCC 101409]MDO3411607.1 TetR/AcrR family transcriptional regulator [Saccharibacillus sp. CPCC 101409]